ncbi:MAG: hypothetical protein K2L12_06860 [Clostridia bacterium]|nr:hypothetical protein [Clostridia bacterium]
MSDNFNKIKKFFTRYTAIKCAVFGVSLGLFAAGVVLLALKLSGIYISPAYYVLIGVGTACAAATALFFIFRPKDKKLAKRLDIEYGLNEKVQTMLAYEGSENELAVIQRETTNSRLGAIKTKLRVSEILKQVIAPVLACAMIVTAAAVPARPGQAATVDPPYVVKEDQFASLKQLISDVKNSYMESGLKSSVAAVLEGLLESVDREEGNEMTNSQMTAAVLSSVAVIDGLIAQADSYIVLGTELKKSENLKDLGNGILKSVVSYKDGSRLRKLDRVNEKSERAEETIKASLTQKVATVSELFAELDGEDLKKAISSFCEIFEGLLANTDYSEKDDGLYNALSKFCTSIKEIGQRVGNGYELSAIQNQISDACTTFVEEGKTLLSAQLYNCMIDEFIRECLSSIFGISLADFPSNANVIYVDKDSPDDNQPSDGKNPNGSGIGNEETLYGSNDIIYSPTKDDYVQYGDVLSEYGKAVRDHLDSNNVPEEYRQFIENYFTILYGDKEKEKN